MSNEDDPICVSRAELPGTHPMSRGNKPRRDDRRKQRDRKRQGA
jgi:hypothetical protein